MEKLKRDKNRINISKLEENDTEEDKISGGYIIKIDKSDMEDGSYTEFNSFKSEYDVFGKKVTLIIYILIMNIRSHL